MKSLIKFIETFSSDKISKWQVSSLYREQKQSIALFGHHIEKKWGILKDSESGEYDYFYGHELEEQAIKKGINSYDLEMQLRNHAKTMAVHSHILFQEAQKVLGKELLEEALKQYHDFSQELMRTIEKLTNIKPNKQDLQKSRRTTNRTDTSIPKDYAKNMKKPHLKIIKDPPKNQLS